MAFGGEVGNKGLNFLGAHVFGMALVVEEDEAASPIYIRLFSTVGVMFEANGSAYLIEKFFGHRRLTFSIS